MAELWGPAAGHAARQQVDTQRALAEMSMRQSESQIRQTDVQTDTAELALQGQRKMLELMNQKDAARTDSAAGERVPGAGVIEGEEIPGQLDELARFALQSGLPQQAAEYATKASTLRNNASEIKKRSAEDRISKLTVASNLLSTVGDEASWRQANALYAMTVGEKSPFADLPYSPEAIAKIQDAVVSQKDRAIAAAADARAAASTAAAAESEARVPLIKAQANLADTRARALEKVGGKPPPAADLRAVTDLIASEFMGAVTPEDARILARPVTERMQEILRESEGLTRTQAARRAFDESQARGDFGGLRPRKRMKGSTENPLEMPTEQTKLRPNMYYKGKGKYAGKTLLWTGTGFQLVSPQQTSESEAELDRELGGGDEGFDNEHTSDVDESY